MSHIDKETTVVVMKTKGKKAGVEIKPLAVQSAATPDTAMQDWTDKFIAKATEAPDADALNTFVASQIKWLDKLPADLRTKADDAVSERLAEFHPTEGRADEDMGEGFTTTAEGF